MPDDIKLNAAIDAYESTAIGSENQGELSKQRTLALEAYHGANLEPNEQGRSQVVDFTIFETVQWILPSLVRIFANDDNIVEFSPVGPDDEDKAEQESDYLNYRVTQKNNWFLTLLTWFQDALLTKNAYCYAFIEEKLRTEIVSYKGQSGEALALLLDEDVEIVSQQSYPDPDDEPKLIDPVSGQEIPPEMHEEALAAFAAQGVEPVVTEPRMLFDVELKSTAPDSQLKFKVIPL